MIEDILDPRDRFEVVTNSDASLCCDVYSLPHRVTYVHVRGSEPCIELDADRINFGLYCLREIAGMDPDSTMYASLKDVIFAWPKEDVDFRAILEEYLHEDDIAPRPMPGNEKGA